MGFSSGGGFDWPALGAPAPNRTVDITYCAAVDTSFRLRSTHFPVDDCDLRPVSK